MKSLFETFQFNDKVTLKNRLVMAPMATWSANEDGTVSDEELAYYAYRSTGVAMVITGTTYAEPTGRGFDGQFYGGSDSMLDSLTQLADAIHAGGAKAILQIFHAGRKGKPKVMPEGVTVSASAIPGKRESNNIPRAMTEEEIIATIRAFKEAMIRAHRAGFDGIEIHGANTYLIQQYFSPHSNRRDDHWGGTLENRMKFPLAIVKVCEEARREIADKDFIIGYRFSPEENSEPGITLEDTDYLIDQLCETELDYLHISLGHFEESTMRDKENHSLTLLRVINRIHGRKPFIGVGSIKTVEDANKALDYGVDLVALGRQLLCDGKTVDKWMANQSPHLTYSLERQSEQCIPDQMNHVILSQNRWIPTEKA